MRSTDVTMGAPERPFSLNVNTVLLSILVGLSTWTLKTVSELSNQMTAVTTRVDQHDRALGGLDTRVSRSEAGIIDLRVRDAAVRQ
jgi:hypothetical protein